MAGWSWRRKVALATRARIGSIARHAGAAAALLAIVLPLAAANPGCAWARDARSPASPVLRIYLARHGQTDWNAAHRLQGVTDTHLNATGRAQAETLAVRLAGVRFDAVYSSMLARSRETATIVHRAAPIDSLADLNERNVGRFQGFVVGSDSAMTAEYQRRINALSDSLDGGESLEHHLTRVSRALDGIRRQHPSGTILVVGHGLTNQLILKDLLGLSWEQANGIAQANDELYMIEIGVGLKLRLWKWIGPENLKDL